MPALRLGRLSRQQPVSKNIFAFPALPFSRRRREPLIHLGNLKDSYGDDYYNRVLSTALSGDVTKMPLMVITLSITVRKRTKVRVVCGDDFNANQYPSIG